MKNKNRVDTFASQFNIAKIVVAVFEGHVKCKWNPVLNWKRV